MIARERARLIAMYGVIAGLHVAGFLILFVFVVPSHYQGLGVGVAVLAYTLGLRHAFDADHISAIDNCTRKVLGERQGTGAPRPLGFGFFFSLGHSTVVVAIGAGIVVAEKTVFGAISGSALSVLFSSASTVLRVPLFLLALLIVRGLPAVLYRSALPSIRDVTAVGLLQATSLPFIVAATTIGLQLHAISPANAAALVAAGLFSVIIFPIISLQLLRPSATGPSTVPEQVHAT